MLAYLYSWIYPCDTVPIAPPLTPSIRLTPLTQLKVPNVYSTPNRIQLSDVLSVKLKKTDIPPKSIEYEPKHPVLRELLMKIPRN